MLPVILLLLPSTFTCLLQPPTLHAPSLISEPTQPLATHSKVAISRRRAVSIAAAVALLARWPEAAAEAAPPFSLMASDAARAFEQGKYEECEQMWQAAADAYPDEDLAWANLAVALIINASDDPTMTLGQPPAGRAKGRLEAALAAIEKATALGSSDALLLNAQGNALGLLLRWGEAREAYASATALSARDFESIPRSNEALTLLQLEQPEQAEKLARNLLRRDPNFVDAQALLATIRWSQRDIGGAAAELSALCDRPTDGQQWCERYSTVDVVLGRWPPRAVATYRDLLMQPSVALIFKNARALPAR